MSAHTDRRRFLAGLAGGAAGWLVTLRPRDVAADQSGVRTAILGRPMLGTVVEAEAHHPDLARARAAIDAGFARVDDVDRLMSIFRADSEISLLNAAAGAGAVAVSEDTYTVLSEACALGRLSRRALDVTIHPLMRLWSRAADAGQVPSRAELDRTAGLVDVGDLALDETGSAARLSRAGAGVDLGGIAKGYAVDAAIDALRARGIASALVNAGGDLRALGRSRGSEPWSVGLRHPRYPSELLLSLLIDNEGVATSANYFRYFTVAGRRYGHVLHPRTGTPAATALSATVVAPRAMRADGLATAALVAGVEGALDLMRRAGVEGLVVSERHHQPGAVLVQATRGLSGRITMLDPTATLDA
jgi:thiamine biosynthesis lipoprotein